MEISIRDEENSPSGLWRTLGKRVGCKPSRVRIPYSPQMPHHPNWVGGASLIYWSSASQIVCILLLRDDQTNDQVFKIGLHLTHGAQNKRRVTCKRFTSSQEG